ncbi:DUF167 family protein [Chelativorans sp. YIM 93263]|uniref:DUF167 family protein n=1 Tax=Chelativorans sp. YIM 93263 TaxID=2906648 RepID=UPI002377E7E2|nr:DUF167 family protein [Chelativorans sp. YIM 93263]
MDSRSAGWLRHTKEHLQIFVRVTPGSSADAIDGMFEAGDGRHYLKVRVRAAPENGKANRALEKLLSKTFRLAKNAVNVTGGTTSRFKTVSIAGDQSEISRKIAAVVDP